MFKDAMKRAAAVILSACMVGTSVDVTSLCALAKEATISEATEAEAPQAAQDPESQEQAMDADAKAGAGEDAAANADAAAKADAKADAASDTPQDAGAGADTPQDAQGPQIATIAEPSVMRVAATKDISDGQKLKVVYSQTEKDTTYDGSQKAPSVLSVQYKEDDGHYTDMKAGTDYIVSYDENLSGTGHIKINGRGEYYNTYDQTFEIRKFNLSHATVDPISPQTYSGEEIQPTVTVKTNWGATLPTWSYVTEYRNVPDAALTADWGKKNVKITADGGSTYTTGETSRQYTVNQKSFAGSGTEFTYIYDQNYEYNGQQQKPQLSIQYNGKPLESPRDYTTAITNNTDATTSAQIKITGQGNFIGSITKTFTITGKDIHKCKKVELKESDFVYTGSQIKPELTIEDDSPLIPNKDYTVTYGQNLNAGEGTVTVKGIGNYSNDKVLTFQIKPYDISQDEETRKITIEEILPQTYTGQKIKPEVTVMDRGHLLKQDTDYTLTYEKNVNVGQDGGKAKVIVHGINNYANDKEAEFEIVPRSLFDADIEVEDWKKPGQNPTPQVTVTYKGEELERTRDYKVEYKDKPNDGRALTQEDDEMEAYVIVSPADGIYNYKDSRSKEFWICGNMNEATVEMDAKITYTGEEIKPVPSKVTSKARNSLHAGEDYEISYPSDTINAGEKSLTLNGIDRYAYSKEVPYTIEPKSLTDESYDFEYEIEDPTYTGQKVMPKVTLKLKNGTTFEQGKDFTLEEILDQNYKDVESGKEKQITIKGKGNLEGEMTVSYHILPRPIGTEPDFQQAEDIRVEGIEADGYDYTGEQITPEIVIKRNGADLTKDSDYSVSVSDNIKAGTGVIMVTGMGNYKGAFKVNFQIFYPLDQSKWASIEVGPAVYNGGEKVKPVLTVKFTDLENGVYETLVEGVDYTVTDWTNNVNATKDPAKASVTITGMGKYKKDLTKQFDISPKDIGAEEIKWSPYIAVTAYNTVARNPQTPTASWRIPLVKGEKTDELGDFYIDKYEDSGDFLAEMGALDPDDDKGDGTGSKCANAGTVKMTIKGRGNYTGQTYLSFEIPRKDIASEEITVALKDAKPNSLPYNGKAQKYTADDLELTYRYNGVDDPTSVKLNSNPKRTDYQITSYKNSSEEGKPGDSDCINAGTITMTLTGEGNYMGERTFDYEITPKQIQKYEGSEYKNEFATDYEVTIAEPNILEDDTLIYNREDQTPKISIKDTKITSEEGQGTDLVLDKDYTVGYTYGKTPDAPKSPVDKVENAGSYTLTITGIGNYTGTYTKDFTVEPRDLNESGTNGEYRFAIVPINDQTYTGSPIIPEELTVFEYNQEDGPDDPEKRTAILVKDVDYEVEGSKNINVTNVAEKAQLTIRGKDNYKGELTAEFTILPKNIEDYKLENGVKVYDVKMEVQELTYNGQNQTPDLPYTYNGIKLSQDTDYTVEYRADYSQAQDLSDVRDTNRNAGPVRGKITGMGNYTGTRVFTEEDPIFVILPRNLKTSYDMGEVTVEDLDSATYDGLPHEPEVVVHDKPEIQAELVKDVDYTVSYDNATDAGDRTATITGINNYTGSIGIHYMIHAKEIIDGNTFVPGSRGSLIAEDWTYTGSDIEPKMDITDTIKQYKKDEVTGELKQPLEVEEVKVTLEEGKDYTLIYENNRNASTDDNKAKVTVQFQGNYAGTYVTEFEIKQRDINDKAMSVDPIDDLIYNKEPQQPEPVIAYGKTEEDPGYTLLRDVDFELTYDEDCTNARTVRIVIKGIGNFKGTRPVTYEILPKSLDAEKSPEITVDPIEPQAYTGNNVVPQVTVKYGDDVLEEGRDYVTAAGPNAVMPGMATVVITGIGNYAHTPEMDPEEIENPPLEDETQDGEGEPGGSGQPNEEDEPAEPNTPNGEGENGSSPSQSESVKGQVDTRIVSFKIMGDLSKNGSIDPIPMFAYTGTELKPTSKVKFLGNVLQEGKDYTIVGWENNTEVGMATFKIVGLDEYYTGTLSTDFKIAYDISKTTMQKQLEVTGLANEYTFTSKAIMPQPSVSYGGVKLRAGHDYNITYKNNVQIGKAELTITGTNFYMGSVTRNFNIVKYSLARCTISNPADVVYDGNEQKPAVVVKDGSKVLASGRDYTVKYAANTNAGVGKVIITGGSNYSGTAIRYFNITVAAPKALKVASNSASSIKLSWTAGGKCTGYEVYRANSKGKYERIKTTKSLTYSNKKLKNSKSYQYKVRAYTKTSTGKVYSKFTNVLTANTTPAKTKVSLSSPKKKQIKIRWTKLKSASGYEIYYSTSKKGKYKKLKTITKPSTVKYTHKKLKSKKKYYYKVRAYKTINGKKVYGAYSSVKSLKAK